MSAKALIQYAWEARGSGWAATVTEEGWKLFGERIREAHRLLDEAIELGVKDGEAYTRLLNLAYAESVPRETADRWLAVGMKLDPTYFSMYTEMAVYLMPRWGGEPGDIEEFAADMADKLSGEDGLYAYGRIALSIQRYECGWGDTILRGDYNPATLVKAAEVLIKRHPKSSRIAHFAALCALIAQDHAAAQRIRPFLGPYDEEDKVWAWQNSLKQFWDWSSAVEVPRGEENWVFSGLTGCPGIAFGNERNQVWIAQQFGRSAANLMDVKTDLIELALPSSGGVVNGFLYDPGRQWAVFSAWNGPLTGWMLLDLSGQREAVVHQTENECRALALHPRQPVVLWADEKTVKSWNLETKTEGPVMNLDEHIHRLVVSRDGTIVAANRWIFDTASGALKFNLDRLTGRTPPGAQHIVDIEADGHVWATGKSAGNTDNSTQLLRFAADGQTAETVLTGLTSDRAWLSHNGKLLAVVGSIQNGPSVSRIDVWNVAQCKRVKQFPGHWNSIKQLAFSPDGSKLASIAMWNDAVKIWSLEGLAD